VTAETVGSREPELVTVALFDYLDQAFPARATLEAAKIPCWLADDINIAISWFHCLAFRRIKLRVASNHANEANELLTTRVAPAESWSETSIDETERCPACDAAEVESLTYWPAVFALPVIVFGVGLAVQESLAGALAAGATFLLTLMLLQRARCDACGARW
jgi:hypothetical protein